MPTFMILGAAKAGTTSLYAYLQQHPQIYLSTPKEPNFFAYGDAPPPDLAGPAADVVRRNAVMTRAAYEQLYRGVRGEHAIGEASVTNLWPRACERIKAYVPEAKLIAVLRQPAERAYSHFLHNRRLGFEPLTDFAQALADEPNRVQQKWPPPLCYQQMSHYAEDLQNYMAHFPREQLHIYLYDDFVARPQQMLQEIFQILGVDETFVADRQIRYNRARLPRYQWLLRFLRQPHWSKTWLKLFLPTPWRSGMARTLQHYNQQKPPPLVPSLRHELSHLFQQEIEQLQGLLGRDLRHWMAQSG